MNHRIDPKRAGFTLVELMVVAAIIAILAAMSLGGMAVARQSANRDRTRATIAKIHSVILPMYDEYKYRRVPINTQGMNPQDAAKARLAALRDLMRMEMPERKTDVDNGPRTFTIGGRSISVPQPSLHAAYQAKVSAATWSPNSSAECLYMVVTIGGGEDARKLFQDSEIADTDNNGLMEFIDAWGQPIQWLRWAPGFNESDLQPRVPPLAPDAAARDDHDPLDSRKADATAWRLVPLIYSPGPDGEPGLAYDFKAGNYTWNADTYTQHHDTATGLDWRIGQPLAVGTHYDNIHNHQLEAR